jgi:hypothetical protein
MDTHTFTFEEVAMLLNLLDPDEDVTVEKVEAAIAQIRSARLAET